MSESTWTNDQKGVLLAQPKRKAWHFVVILAVLVGAVAFVLFNAIEAGGTQMYLTVDEYLSEESRFVGRDIRVSGWVVGDSIQFTQISANESRLEFDIVDDLTNPSQRLRIVAYNEPKPDLLQHEANALVEGRAGDPGAFVANKDGLLLKCPTRYEEGEEHPADISLGDA